MAENKKSFQLYTEWIETFSELTDAKAGKLIKHIFDYVNDKNPETDDEIIKLLFIPIKQQLKRDLKKWESRSLQNSKNAKIRWDAKSCERIITDAKNADKVEVEDKVKDNTIVLKTESIDKWILELKTQTQFLDGLYMTHKLRQNTLGKIAMLFKEHLKMHPKNHENFIDFRNHFGTWVGFKIKKGELGEYLKHQKGEL